MSIVTRDACDVVANAWHQVVYPRICVPCPARRQVGATSRRLLRHPARGNHPLLGPRVHYVKILTRLRALQPHPISFRIRKIYLCMWTCKFRGTFLSRPTESPGVSILSVSSILPSLWTAAMPQQASAHGPIADLPGRLTGAENGVSQQSRLQPISSGGRQASCRL